MAYTGRNSASKSSTNTGKNSASKSSTNTGKNSALKGFQSTSVNSATKAPTNIGKNLATKAPTNTGRNSASVASNGNTLFGAIKVPFSYNRNSATSGIMFTQIDGGIRGLFNTAMNSAIETIQSTSADAALRGLLHLYSDPYRLAVYAFLPIAQDRDFAITALANDEASATVRALFSNTKGVAISGDVKTKSSFIFNNLNLQNFAATAQHDDVATVLRILFKYDFATGEFEGSLQLEAPEEIIKYGRIEKIIEARWVPTHRQALALGTRYLRYIAKPRWAITFDTASKEALCNVGDDIFIEYPISPVSGKMVVMKTDYSVNNLSARITAEYVSKTPTRIIMSDIGKLDRTVSTPGSIVYENGVATISIVDANDVAMVGATVTLDGRTSQISDKAGKVRFTTTKGKHVLLVENDDYVPVEIGVEF